MYELTVYSNIYECIPRFIHKNTFELVRSCWYTEPVLEILFMGKILRIKKEDDVTLFHNL